MIDWIEFDVLWVILDKITSIGQRSVSRLNLVGQKCGEIKTDGIQNCSKPSCVPDWVYNNSNFNNVYANNGCCRGGHWLLQPQRASYFNWQLQPAQADSTERLNRIWCKQYSQSTWKIERYANNIQTSKLTPVIWTGVYPHMPIATTSQGHPKWTPWALCVISVMCNIVTVSILDISHVKNHLDSDPSRSSKVKSDCQSKARGSYV